MIRHNSGLPMKNYHKGASDPIYYFEQVGWGHFDELWCDFYGGYETEKQARERLADYCKENGLCMIM